MVGPTYRPRLARSRAVIRLVLTVLLSGCVCLAAAATAIAATRTVTADGVTPPPSPGLALND